MPKELTRAKLRYRLDYNKETGWFIWKRVRGKKVKVGDRAGYEHHGYRYITLEDKQYPEHYLAWFYETGVWPKRIIDHKNLNRSDNRFENLRERVTDSQNQHNTTVRLNNKLGALGVIKSGNYYKARIRVDGARLHLGYYKTIEEAAKAYEEARAAAFGPRLHTDEDMKLAVEKRIAKVRHQLGYKKKVYKTPKERFYENFKVDETTGCWNWTGRLWDKTGYGVFKSKELAPRPITASRASLLIHNGSVPAGVVVRHKCDNRQCVNPDHLELGTQKQNMEDCVERDRFSLLWISWVMYAIIVVFLLSSGSGEGVLSTRYATLTDCEGARLAQVALFKEKVEEHHQITITGSYCGLPSSLGATGI